MDDLIAAILQPIADFLGLGDSEGGGGFILPGGGELWAVLLTIVCVVGAFLIWLWVG
jgi:hypothetical protein